jgi:hypothetical protein
MTSDHGGDLSSTGFPAPSQPTQSFTRPAKLAPSPYRGAMSVEGRVPTPISNAFVGSGIPRTVNGSNTTPPLSGGLSPFQAIRSPMAPPPRRFVPRDHPMPSPIRESLASPRDSMLSPAQAGSMETSLAAATQMSKLSMTSSDGMDIDDDKSPAAPPPAGSPFALSSPNRGRKRSGALLSEKRRFVMGFIKDCEKCRKNVPGHYAHYIAVNE